MKYYILLIAILLPFYSTSQPNNASKNDCDNLIEIFNKGNAAFSENKYVDALELYIIVLMRSVDDRNKGCINSATVDNRIKETKEKLREANKVYNRYSNLEDIIQSTDPTQSVYQILYQEGIKAMDVGQKDIAIILFANAKFFNEEEVNIEKILALVEEYTVSSNHNDSKIVNPIVSASATLGTPNQSESKTLNLNKDEFSKKEIKKIEKLLLNYEIEWQE